MIKLFNITDKTFNSNGDIVLQPLKAKVHNEDNGEFYLDLELGLDYSDYLTSGKIITANTPQGTQAFRIADVTKTRTKITIKAWHVYFDSKNYLIADSYVVNKNCNDALNWLNNALEPVSEFTVSSDITSINSYRCVRESFHDAINVVLERWGGHLVRDNFDIKIKEDISNDYGAVIRYRKNLREITCISNWENVVTKILPVGKDGTLLNAVNPSASIYITSSTQYDIPFTKTVSFEQDIEREDYDSDTAYLTALVNDLTAQATAYMAENCVPKVNYTLKANLDHVTDIGDVIMVIDERLGLSLTTQVIKYEYDCLTEQYTEIEFGNFKKTLSGLISGITNTVTGTVDQQIINATDALQTEISGKSTVTVDQTVSTGTEIGSITIDGTETKLYAPQSDYVVEQGTISTYTKYRKWNSGKVECWYHRNVTGITTAVWSGTLAYLDSTDFSAIWNGLFNAVPDAVFASSNDSQFISIVPFSYTKNGISNLRFLSWGTKTNDTVGTSIYAVGTWK